MGGQVFLFVSFFNVGACTAFSKSCVNCINQGYVLHVQFSFFCFRVFCFYVIFFSMYRTALLSKFQLSCIDFDSVLHVHILLHCIYYFRGCIFLHHCILCRVFIHLRSAELDCYGVLHRVTKCTAFV